MMGNDAVNLTHFYLTYLTEPNSFLTVCRVATWAEASTRPVRGALAQFKLAGAEGRAGVGQRSGWDEEKM